jgi:hypothetical protein
MTFKVFMVFWISHYVEMMKVVFSEDSHNQGHESNVRVLDV